MNTQKIISENKYISSQQPSLCWKCKHIVPDPNKKIGCAWSIKGKPIIGWEAIPRSIPGNKFYARSYKVLWCPLFEEG